MSRWTDYSIVFLVGGVTEDILQKEALRRLIIL